MIQPYAISGCKFIFIAALLCLMNYQAKAQNAFLDAQTLYNWQHSKSNDTATLKKVEIILGKINLLSHSDEANPVLSSLKFDFLKRSFDARLKSDNGLYEDIIKKIYALKEKKPLTDPIIKKIFLHNEELDSYNKISVNLQSSISSLNTYAGSGADDISAGVRKKATDTCTTNSIFDPECYKKALKNALDSKVLELAALLKKNNKNIDSLQAVLRNDVRLLGETPSSFKDLGIIDLERRFANVVNSLKANVNIPSEISNKIRSEQEQSTTLKRSAEMSNSMLTETEMIDAMATYLAKRVKQEAVIYFVQRWKDTILSLGLETILPETTKKFVDWQPYTVPNFDNSWKYAFSKDLLNLPKTGVEYLAKHDKIINQEAKVYFDYLQDALKISEKVKKHYNYMEIVESLAGDSSRVSKLKPTGLKTFLRLAYVINEELYQANEYRDYWVTPNVFLTTMQNNDELARIFISIIAKKYPDINAYLKANIKNMSADDISNIKNWIGDVLMVLNHFQNSQKIQVNEKGYNANSYWLNLSEVIHVFLQQDSVIKDSSKFKEGLEKTQEFFEVYALIQNKNYPAAANKMLSVFKAYIAKGQDKMFAPAIEITLFASEILQTQGTTELAAVIESHALPPASYRLKQNFSSLISLGAYFGPYAGAEFIKNENAVPVVGFSTPISLDFSWNKKPKKLGERSKGYTTLSLIFFDLGSVVSYRLTNEGAGLPSKARWSQLFAPGVNFRFGLGDTPLTVSIGGQLTPQLRDFNNSTNKDAIRLSAGLLIDLPLLLLKKGTPN